MKRHALRVLNPRNTPGFTIRTGWGFIPLPGHRTRRQRARTIAAEVIGPRSTTPSPSERTR